MMLLDRFSFCIVCARSVLVTEERPFLITNSGLEERSKLGRTLAQNWAC
jgi:hypothetical protein